MRAKSLVAVGTAAAVACLAVPAAVAAPVSDDLVATAYATMLNAKDAAALGVSSRTMHEFTVTTADRGTPDGVWLCDLSADQEVEGRGGGTLLSSSVMSLRTGDVSDVSQDIHVYSSPAKAKAAYDQLLKEITRCEGEQQPADDAETGPQGGTTTTLTNGTGKAPDGDRYVWVKSVTTMAGANGIASHQYVTVRHFGTYLQVIEVESEGTNASPLTAKQVRVANSLTDSLGDRWQSAVQG